MTLCRLPLVDKAGHLLQVVALSGVPCCRVICLNTDIGVQLLFYGMHTILKYVYARRDDVQCWNYLLLTISAMGAEPFEVRVICVCTDRTALNTPKRPGWQV